MRAIEFTNEMAGKIHGGIRQALLDKGYKYLGGGIDKQAYLEPNGQVYIVFGYRQGHYLDFSPDQKMFVNWINYCNKNQNNPHLPKFSGFESFEFQGKKYIQARMETLRELPKSVGKVVYLLDQATRYAGKGDSIKAWEKIADWAQHDSFDNDDEPEWFEADQVIDYLGGLDKAKALLQTVQIVKQFARKHNYSLDLHSGNYMQRPNGTIVVNDPFVIWERNL